jgi:aspartyl/asparaginyl-tRNA synthetase
LETGLWGRRRILQLLMTGMIFFLVGFDFFDSSTPIKTIKDNPRDFEGKTITVSGEVTDIYSLLIIKFFVLRDKTGEIRVITERIMPKKGTSIKVKGQVVEAFSFGDMTVTAVKELKEKE